VWVTPSMPPAITTTTGRRTWLCRHTLKAALKRELITNSGFENNGPFHHLAERF